MKKYPFFICVDDGGFPFVQDSIAPPKNPIPFGAYETLIRVAKKFGLKIPLAITLGYFDIKNVSGLSRGNNYGSRLIKLLKDNKDNIEIAYHGLTHNFGGQKGEFSPRTPKDIQYEHIKESQQIFTNMGIRFPKIFIPPYHLWQPGVTDRILKDFGVKYIVTAPRTQSRYLKVFLRGSLGIFSDDLKLSRKNFERAKRHILPAGILDRIICHHRLSSEPYHSYITHIGNFAPQCQDFWFKLLNYIKNSEELYLVKTNSEAVRI